MIILTIHLLISLGTFLARENIEGSFWFFSNSVRRCSEVVPGLIYCLFEATSLNMCIIP